MKKKFKDLTPNDFPGINPEKFEEWKRERRIAQRNAIIFLILFSMIHILLFIYVGFYWIGFTILIPILLIISLKFLMLTIKLGITKKAINEKLRGQKEQSDKTK